MNLENKKILVTGASSGIGLSLATKLSELGASVVGIGRSFPDEVSFKSVCFDLREYEKISGLYKHLKEDGNFDIIINNAGIAYYGLAETLSPEQIHDIIATNFQAPLILTSLALSDLKREGGRIVNVSSVTANKENPHGAVYGATKAGLDSFGKSIFEEARKTGVSVLNIHPDMTETNLYREADFTAYPEREYRLLAEEVADLIIGAISLPSEIAVTDITVRPIKHRIKRKND